MGALRIVPLILLLLLDNVSRQTIVVFIFTTIIIMFIIMLIIITIIIMLIIIIIIIGVDTGIWELQGHHPYDLGISSLHWNQTNGFLILNSFTHVANTFIIKQHPWHLEAGDVSRIRANISFYPWSKVSGQNPMVLSLITPPKRTLASNLLNNFDFVFEKTTKLWFDLFRFDEAWVLGQDSDFWDHR